MHTLTPTLTPILALTRRDLDRASVHTALTEIRHFLQTDPRLPAKTRYAVQASKEQ